jgi:hypothetical protein
MAFDISEHTSMLPRKAVASTFFVKYFLQMPGLAIDWFQNEMNWLIGAGHCSICSKQDGS